MLSCLFRETREYAARMQEELAKAEAAEKEKVRRGMLRV